ncbi:MAG TPA: hypothetical protein VF796_08315, partial [Humisphaera sp.]
PPGYAHKACGMVWCDRIVWGTWFTASPSWIYGIQWLPYGPHAAFYDRDRSFVQKTAAQALKELDAFEEKEAAKKPGKPRKPADVKTMGGELGAYHLGFLMHADPAGAVEQIDKLWADPAAEKVARDPWMAGVYYQASALRGLGRVDWACHASSPTAMVYANEATKARTFVAWNPTAAEQSVEFFEGGRSLGKLKVPARSIASGTTLEK